MAKAPTRNSRATADSTALRIVTVNITAWQTQTQWVTQLGVDVIALQEHRLDEAALRPAREFARARGWQAHFESTGPKPARGAPSGGTAILVRGRRPSAIRPMEAMAAGHKGRITCTTVCSGTAGHVVFLSIYGVCGDSVANACFRGEIARVLNGLRHSSWVVLGDWNASPGTVQGCAFIRRVGGTVVAASDHTYESSAGRGTTIDFAVVGRPFEEDCLEGSQTTGRPPPGMRPSTTLWKGRPKCRV